MYFLENREDVAIEAPKKRRSALICLNMIVRNEVHIIEETLKNVCNHFPIARWVISDTGSSDGTQDIIKKTFSRLGIPGELRQDEWQDFSHNRNEALQSCLGKSEYILFFDADDSIEGRIELPDLTADAYRLHIRNESGTSFYTRKLLVKNSPSLVWRGVVHEFLDGTGGNVHNLQGNYAVVSRRKGARSQDPEKYKKDALLLEAAISEGRDRDLLPRYAFYCGNSWSDFGNFDRALKWYVFRTKLDDWREENYVAHLRAALQLEKKERFDLALDFLIRGHDLVPDRAECLYHAARILRYQSKFRSALIFAKEALMIPKPVGNRLFVNKAIYDYWAAYEVLFLTARLGGNPRLIPHFESFMMSKAPETSKKSIISLIKGEAL